MTMAERTAPTFYEPIGSQGERVLYVHGYGGMTDDEGLLDLLQGIADGGYTVHCALLPRSFSDLDKDIVAHLKEHVLREDVRHAVGFSLGALALSFLELKGVRVFISPLWGLGPLMDRTGVLGALALASGHSRAAMERGEGGRKLGLHRLNGPFEAENGAYMTAMAVSDALRSLPPPSRTDLVIASRSDHLVSLEAIESRGVRTIYLKGGHMLLSGKDRQRLVGLVIDALKGPSPGR